MYCLSTSRVYSFLIKGCGTPCKSVHQIPAAKSLFRPCEGRGHNCVTVLALMNACYMLLPFQLYILGRYCQTLQKNNVSHVGFLLLWLLSENTWLHVQTGTIFLQKHMSMRVLHFITPLFLFRSSTGSQNLFSKAMEFSDSVVDMPVEKEMEDDIPLYLFEDHLVDYTPDVDGTKEYPIVIDSNVSW